MSATNKTYGARLDGLSPHCNSGNNRRAAMSEAHAATDDMAEFGVSHRDPLIKPQGRAEQGWPARRYSPEHTHCGCPIEAASACSELGANQPRKRLGGIGPVHRAILHRTPTFTCAAVVALSLFCAVLWVLR